MVIFDSSIYFWGHLVHVHAMCTRLFLSCPALSGKYTYLLLVGEQL